MLGIHHLMFRQIRTRLRFYAYRVQRFVFRKLLHADDPPHELALGAAIGVFVTFTPTVGFQMAITVFLAWLLRVNKVVGLPIVWITNPATIVPIYYSCYVVGRSILQRDPVADTWWRQLSNPPPGWWPTITHYWVGLLEIATPLWVGSVVLGLLTAYPTYYGLYHAIRIYRMRRWGQLVPPKRRRRKSEA